MTLRKNPKSCNSGSIFSEKILRADNENRLRWNSEEGNEMGFLEDEGVIWLNAVILLIAGIGFET